MQLGQAGSGGGGVPLVDSLQTSGRDGARREAPLDARDMMMRGDDSASSGSIFSRLKIGEELTKVKNMTQAGVGKVVQTLGMKRKEGDDAPKAGATSYDPPSLGDLSSNYVRMAGFGGGGGSSAAQAPASGTPGKLALPAGNGQAVMGGTAEGGSQLRCYNCTVIMSYPPGATKVKCPTCDSINATAAPGSTPAAPSANNISVSCSGCHQPTICPSTTKRLGCQHCGVANIIITCDNSRCNAIISTSEGTPVMSCPACNKIHQLGAQAAPPPPLHVTCVKCSTRLQMPGDAPAVRCPKCAQVTNRSDPRARAQSVTEQQVSASATAPSSERRGVSFAPDLQRTAEEKAIEEAIRRSLGEPAPQARPVAGRMNQRKEQEAAGRGEPDEDQLLAMLTSFADITGCDLPVAQEYLQANGWRMEVAINNYLNRSTSASASTGGSATNSHANNDTDSGTTRGPQGQPPAEALLFDFAALSQPAPALSQIASTRPPPQPAAPADPFGFASAATSAAVSAASQKGAAVDAAPRATGEEEEPRERETIEWLGIEDWLAGMGLEKYLETLKSQELTDPDALRDLTDEDLKEMEVGTIGARRKILAAIRRLNEAEVVMRGKSVSSGHPVGEQAVDPEVPAQGMSVADIRADGEIEADGAMHSGEDFFGKPIVAQGEISVDSELSEAIVSEGGIAAGGGIAADAMASGPILADGHIAAEEVVSEPILADGHIAADEVVSEPIISGEVAGVAAEFACQAEEGMTCEGTEGGGSDEEVAAEDGALKSS